MKSLFSHFFNFKFSRNWGYLFASGFLLFFLLIFQFFSGLALSLNLGNNFNLFSAFHSLLASLIVLIIYIHIYKSIFYRVDLGFSDRYSFFSGILLFFIILSTAFTGYVLPWGQMSYWGTKVITSFLDLIPFYGERLKFLILGDFVVSVDKTLPRFFSIHIFLGCFVWLFVFIHICAVHSKKSVCTPFASLETSFKTEYLYPVAYLKDFYLSSLFLLFFGIYFTMNFSFFEEFLNNCPITLDKTPFNVVPEWYFLPSFSVLKYFSIKSVGVFFSIIVLLSIFVPVFCF